MGRLVDALDAAAGLMARLAWLFVVEPREEQECDDGTAGMRWDHHSGQTFTAVGRVRLVWAGGHAFAREPVLRLRSGPVIVVEPPGLGGALICGRWRGPSRCVSFAHRALR